MAQIAQVTYVTLSDVLGEDYIRTATAKGLPARIVRDRHALRNILIPILTTIGTSLRFSLASLPVVELFFDWPGIGLTLIEAIQAGENALVVDLILSLGLFFLLLNSLIETLFPLLDPRLLSQNTQEVQQDHTSFLGWWRGIGGILTSWMQEARDRLRRKGRSEPLPPLTRRSPAWTKESRFARSGARLWWIVRHFFTNPTLVLGSLLLLGLVALVFIGPRLTAVNPYQTNGVMTINGKIFAPPFAPSSVFPWGSDYVGRDIQALVLNGAQKTLSLAFFCMLARLLLGATLGALAGWQRGSWLDQIVMSGIGIWAAFPITLFSMIVIQALGIQQGMWVFVVALSVVGWGEVAQFVRGQVAAIKPLAYIESARSVGARSDQIMTRHVVPNLVNSLIVLAVLEMGGIMMLLAELGYLDTFMGGGFQAAIGETGRMQSIVVHYSDVPEWAALIANIRQWWRSYPWMALYPGLAFFLAILAFNLFGEGLRRFLDESQLSLSRLFNRYTFMASVGAAVILGLTLQSASPLGLYRAEGERFDAQNVQRDIMVLSWAGFHGRETGTPGAAGAADYIAQRMKEVGLLPAGEHGTYLLSNAAPRLHLTQIPILEVVNAGGPPTAFTYRKDFAESGTALAFGEAQQPLMGIAFGPDPAGAKSADPYGLRNTDAVDHIAIVRAADFPRVNPAAVGGILVVEDQQYSIEKKFLFPNMPAIVGRYAETPVLVVKPEIAETLLKTAGSSLDQLDQMRTAAPPGGVLMTPPGATVHLSVRPELVKDLTSEDYINVIGVLPGEASVAGMDSEVVMVSAYYDGLGVGPDGTLYPGANDNASGVATLLELARVLKDSPYRPNKTVLFVAWAGGERSEGLSVVNVMNARPGGLDLTVTEVIELSGVGAGSGNAIALGDGSSYRLVRLFQSAAEKYNVSTTTRGRGPHYGRQAAPGFGDRKAFTLLLSWDGSDAVSHTPADTPKIIDPAKLSEVGRSTLLTLFVLSRESSY
jgi:peptide/nickel transport system permease protein